MATGQAAIHVDRDPDTVWKVVGDFGGLASWMPTMEKCEVEGDVRVVQTMGMEIREQLRSRDDASRTISYGIVGGPVPLDHHEATISVTAAGSGSDVTWSYEVAPDNLGEVFGPVYQQGLDQLKAHFDS